MKIDIYIDTDVKGTKSGRGHVWYLMSASPRGIPVTKLYEVTFDDHNIHGASLEGLLDALRHIKVTCELTIYTDSSYISSQINAGNIYLWEKRDYQTAGGAPIRYKDLWKQIISLIREKCCSIFVITPVPDREKEEMRKARKGA